MAFTKILFVQNRSEDPLWVKSVSKKITSEKIKLYKHLNKSFKNDPQILKKITILKKTFHVIIQHLQGIHKSMISMSLPRAIKTKGI